jgi:hypothetical protein
MAAMADLGVTGLLEMPPAGTLNLIAAAGTVEPEPVVGQAQGVPQMLGLGRGDRQRLALGTAITEVQRVMIDMQLLPGSGLEHLQVLRGMSRSDVLDISRAAPVRMHDLHRGRPTRGPHRPDVGHTARLENPN